MFSILYSLYFQYKLAQYRRAGLQISPDCSLPGGLPSFGSEPYLITIGKNVRISGRVTFITHDGGTWIFRNIEGYRRILKYGRIVIHDNCFIGFGVTILPGVSIGPNSVVGAHALVSKDVPAGRVAAGVPARVIMSSEEYAAKCLSKSPTYDPTEYKLSKRAVLERVI